MTIYKSKNPEVNREFSEGFDLTVEQIANMIRKNIDELENYLSRKLKLKVKLKVSINRSYIEISSDDLLKQDSDLLLNSMFKELNINFCGGSYNSSSTEELYFEPHVDYEHVDGGSNGCRLFGRRAYVTFNITTEKWKFYE